jgi:hypothetical protein
MVMSATMLVVPLKANNTVASKHVCFNIFISTRFILIMRLRRLFKHSGPCLNVISCQVLFLCKTWELLLLLNGTGSSRDIEISSVTMQKEDTAVSILFVDLASLAVKNNTSWDVMSWSSLVHRRFGGMYSFHIQYRKISQSLDLYEMRGKKLFVILFGFLRPWSINFF